MTVPKKKTEVELNNWHHHSNTWCPLLHSTSAFFFGTIYIYGLLASKVLALHRCWLRHSCAEGNAEFTPSTITIVCASKSRTGVQVSFMYGTKNAM